MQRGQSVQNLNVKIVSASLNQSFKINDFLYQLEHAVKYSQASSRIKWLNDE